jgi:hypothetical protein
MQNISVQDRKFFDKMYPKNKSGQFLAMIAYDHRKMDENLDENKDDEKKRMKGAKLKLKMGDALDEMREPFVVVDTADGNKVVGTASDEKGAKDIITTAELPPVKIKNKKTLKIVKTRKKQMIGQPLQEDGHTDVSSAIRQCKTVLEDAMQIMGKLKSMSGEDSLPTWWTNKLAVASNSMNKMRDYLLVPSDGMNEQLQEAMGDMEDLKKVVAELQNASKMHLAQSKRVQAHVDMMKDAGMDKNDVPKKEETITSKDLLDNKFKEEKNGAQHFSKIEEDKYVWNFVYDDFGRTKLTTEPDKATHLVYTMEGKDNPQLLKISEKEILDYKKGENYELSKKKEK